MQHLLKPLLSLLLLICLFSCEKQSQEPDPPTPPTSPTEQLLILIKQSEIGRADTSSQVIDYDNQNRLIKRRWFEGAFESIDKTVFSFAGNNIYVAGTIGPFPNYYYAHNDTTELDSYKMPSKKRVALHIWDSSSTGKREVYTHTSTDYQYSSSGFPSKQIEYVRDSTIVTSNADTNVSIRMDTTVSDLLIENDNVKSLSITTYSNNWTTQNGIKDFFRNIRISGQEFQYTKNYPNHPVNEINGQYFIYQLYTPFNYFSTRKNFKNLPDKILFKEPYGNYEVNYVLTFTDKGYIKTIDSDFPAPRKYQFYYK